MASLSSWGMNPALEKARRKRCRLAGQESIRSPDFDWPRSLSILAAAFLPNTSGKTSRALRARKEVSCIETGFSRFTR
jgi:hypothetical protein